MRLEFEEAVAWWLLSILSEIEQEVEKRRGAKLSLVEEGVSFVIFCCPLFATYPIVSSMGLMIDDFEFPGVLHREDGGARYLKRRFTL